MTSLAFEPWGNYSLALAASAECLNVEPWTSSSTTPEALKLGVEASPEFACLSFKASTGHFLEAAGEGVEYGVIVNSVGTCRLRYYRMLQQKILEERGLKMFIFGFGYDGIKPPLIRHFDPSLGAFLRCCARARLKTLAVDDIEREAWRVRAIETHKGDTTRMMSGCLRDLDNARTTREIRKVRRGISARFAGIPTDAGRVPLKVGLLGEATVLRNKYLNHNLEEVLGGLGVEVRNFFLLGEEIRNIFHIGLWSKYSRRAIKKLARPYLKSLVGGHAMDSVGNTIRCAREGYDGVVHVCPTGCMPEISVRPILRKIGQDTGIPILECSFDEHTSHVGVVTRLEAFVDILYDRRRKKKSA
jgi:predicted nucleotide-binding protein (sugar kinase/HSP70/actin superfamily)